MNYQKIHDDLVKQCREQVLPKGVYTEKHHIIPRSLGGGEGQHSYRYSTTTFYAPCFVIFYSKKIGNT